MFVCSFEDLQELVRVGNTLFLKLDLNLLGNLIVLAMH